MVALGALSAVKAESGAAAGSSTELAEELRTWLCLHLPEEELPEEFAAGRGQLRQGFERSPEPRRSSKGF